ncbi:MAG TPA: LutB/LldF family L-lactate oxidation iron-sulfur protein [Polyangia bacterium]
MTFAMKGDLATRSEAALSDDFLRGAVRFTVDRLRVAKAGSTAALGAWEAWRERGRAIRSHTIENLDHYLERFVANATARGVIVHFAADAAEATGIILGLLRAVDAKLVVKSKSMLTEEIGLNESLTANGMEVVETDLGEWIVQLAHETPSHIILPAIHKQRRDIQALFEAEGREKLAPETKVLAGYARRRMREKFAQADVGITGCNFAVAETGSVVLFTNEGNGRMVTTLPETHIAVMGMERIVPTFDDLEVMAMLLPRSATGQKLTTYVNVLSGPRGAAEADGPRVQHVVIVDNGRSLQLGDPQFREVLNCIRCGACLNVCPVYRHIGGHAYGSVYSGPIGAVLTPLLQLTPRAGELANASSLCGACFEACPVKIPLHDMLVQLRRRNVESGAAPASEALGMRVYGRLFSSPRLFRLAGTGLRLLARLLARTWLRRWAATWGGPLGAWIAYRTIPLWAPGRFRKDPHAPSGGKESST